MSPGLSPGVFSPPRSSRRSTLCGLELLQQALAQAAPRLPDEPKRNTTSIEQASPIPAGAASPESACLRTAHSTGHAAQSCSPPDLLITALPPRTSGDSLPGPGPCCRIHGKAARWPRGFAGSLSPSPLHAALHRRAGRARLTRLQTPVRAALHDCRVVELGAGRHCLQEDHLDAIGRATAGWIEQIEAAAEATASPSDPNPRPREEAPWT